MNDVSDERWLADYHSGPVVVWCENSECEYHHTGVQVSLESEYGQRWYVPEECPLCHHGWLAAQPANADREEEG